MGVPFYDEEPPEQRRACFIKPLRTTTRQAISHERIKGHVFTFHIRAVSSTLSLLDSTHIASANRLIALSVKTCPYSPAPPALPECVSREIRAAPFTTVYSSSPGRYGTRVRPPPALPCRPSSRSRTHSRGVRSLRTSPKASRDRSVMMLSNMVTGIVKFLFYR